MDGLLAVWIDGWLAVWIDGAGWMDGRLADVSGAKQSVWSVCVLVSAWTERVW